MKRPLRVLLVEDSEDDAELVLMELGRGDYEVVSERVETPENLTAALDKGGWDAVISDWAMPRFSARRALEVVRRRDADLPFIIVSGTIGEETAVEAMRAGAQDVVLKDRLARLVPAIEREVREAEGRRDRANIQAQLMVSDRMASVGTLAAGVAHEINNPLAAVMANLDLALRDLTDVSSRFADSAGALAGVQDGLRDARESASRIRNIVRDLRIFSRREDEKRGPVDVQRVMESTLRMAWNEIRHRAKLSKNYEEAPPADACESRLGQVFLNLVMNAAQAIPEGHADVNEIQISTRREADRVVIEIADTGPGIPEEVMKNLFTPFVTTKPAGIGTGLGLSICHRIVTGFGGEIRVESRLGQGTTFKVMLLIAPPAVEGASPVPPAAPSRAARRGRVLIVDDEPLIIRTVQRTLGRDHDLIPLSHAREALRRISAGERFDVILCDLMMPEMTGMELHAALLRVAPEQAGAMVFLTGGAFTPQTRSFLDQVENQRVEKPFDAMQLKGLINERVK